jgi:hypothetical protein
MTNYDNQPGIDRPSGISSGTITAIVAAVLIVGALFMWGPWNNGNRTATNAVSGTTTGQTSSVPRATTPAVTPAAPGTPATTGTVR